MPAVTRFAVLLFTAAAPWAVQANTICCEANGKTYCDYGVPPACQGKAYRVLNLNGTVLKQVAAPLTPEQIAKRKAELALQREEEEKQAEQDRQDRRLVSTYPSLSDMDIGHERQLVDLKRGQQQMEQKLAEAEKKKKQLANEAEFYKKNTIPGSLKSQIELNEKDIVAQKKAIDTRGHDIETAKGRFDEEKRRYMRLTEGSAERMR